MSKQRLRMEPLVNPFSARSLSFGRRYSTMNENGDKEGIQKGEPKQEEPKKEKMKEEDPIEGEEVSIESLQEKLVVAETELTTVKDQHLRLLADMENLRRRTQEDVKKASKFGIQKFAKEIVSIADLLEMAIDSIPKSELSVAEQKHLRDLHKGVELTLNEMIATFKRHGIEQINPIQQKFDANYHNALYEVVAENEEDGTILAVQKKGYTLNDRLIRPAEVGVSKPKK